jgi:hypothetical protein
LSNEELFGSSFLSQKITFSGHKLTSFRVLFSDSLILLKIFHFPTNPYSTLSSQPSGYKNRSKLACLLGILIPPPTTYLSSPQKNPKTSKTEFSLDDKPRRKREITIFAIDLILCPLIFGILSPSFFKTMTLHI